MNEIERITKLNEWSKENDWNEHFRYVLGAKVAYEIFVEYHYLDTPIETAKASLCITGLWYNKDGSTTMEREWLGKHLPIQELLEIAKKDFIENS